MDLDVPSSIIGRAFPVFVRDGTAAGPRGTEATGSHEHSRFVVVGDRKIDPAGSGDFVEEPAAP
jgi:hypothetical protein